MASDAVITVKDAVHKLQLCLLEGTQDENKLFAAGLLMSQSDYLDVVTERSLANMCGYPICGNTLPSERPKKGRYRISLKEHKVYDLQETYMYCSTRCVVNSRAFAASLKEERSSDLKPAKLNEVLRLFAGLNLDDSNEDLRKENKLELSELRIHEKVHAKGGDVSLEEWVGPSNAIEGYVPQRDNKEQQLEKLEKDPAGKKPKQHKLTKKKDQIFNEMDFSSTIITQDKYSISKTLGPTKTVSAKKTRESNVILNDKDTKGQPSKLVRSVPLEENFQKMNLQSDELHSTNFVSENIIDLTRKMNEMLSVSDPCQIQHNTSTTKADSDCHAHKASTSNAVGLKPSLKSSTTKKVTRAVTWADEVTYGDSSKSLCEYKELEDRIDTCTSSGSAEMEVDDDPYRFLYAEACARALTEAAEAVASGDSDVSDAVTEAGIIILPPPHEVDETETLDECGMLDSKGAHLDWPTEPGLANSDLLDYNNSWYDTPPEGFSLNLSPFASMFMVLFAWVSSSTLAYIYGHDESLHEEYLSVNGREYPRKILLSDGRSSEIRQALSGCLARALPGLVSDLRLPMPVSTLEKELDHLLDSMSFLDPLPPFRMKQWQLIVFLFLDALSVCRIPTLTPYMTGRRVLLPKVLEGANIIAQEYETMKDLIIPLGRVPQFAMQNGG